LGFGSFFVFDFVAEKYFSILALAYKSILINYKIINLTGWYKYSISFSFIMDFHIFFKRRELHPRPTPVCVMKPLLRRKRLPQRHLGFGFFHFYNIIEKLESLILGKLYFNFD